MCGVEFFVNYVVFTSPDSGAFSRQVVVLSKVGHKSCHYSGSISTTNSDPFDGRPKKDPLFLEVQKIKKIIF